jgi:hypothetical protein
MFVLPKNILNQFMEEEVRSEHEKAKELKYLSGKCKKVLFTLSLTHVDIMQ